MGPSIALTHRNAASFNGRVAAHLEKRSLKWRFGVTAALLPIAVFADGSRVAADDDRAKVGVNWAGPVIQVTASGAPDMKAVNRAQARLGAERAARRDALRSLLAEVERLPIRAGKTVGDEIATDGTRAKVERALEDFRIVRKRYYSDGGVELDVELPLSVITAALLPAATSGLASKAEGVPKNTGLVVDARGVSVTPALAPRLLDEVGRPLYTAEVLTEEARKSRGVAAWVKSLAEAKKHERAGRNPMVVKAAQANGTDLVIAPADAKRLSQSNNGFLAEGRVVIVIR